MMSLEELSGTHVPMPIRYYNDGPCTSTEPSACDSTRQIRTMTNRTVPNILRRAKPSRDSENEVEICTGNRYAWLEYVPRTDGSVICKRCGEILRSRTQWYRHKYKRHAVQPFVPSPLYQCGECLSFFKSRKGYLGHVARGHNGTMMGPTETVTSETVTSETVTSDSVKIETVTCEAETSEILTNESDVNFDNLIILDPFEIKCEPELEVASTSSAPYRPPARRHSPLRAEKKSKVKELTREDWEAKRIKEERLIAEIIDRVKRECEAQGPGGGERRGYTRRTTVMHHPTG